MGIFKRLLFLFALLAISLSGLELVAQDSASKVPEKKTKAELKLNKTVLKESVRTRPNGDILLKQFPKPKNFLLTMPRNLDLFFDYYFPWIDTKIILEKYRALEDKTIDGIFNEFNSVLAKTGSRFNKLNITENNIKSRIQNGVHLIWCGAEINNFYQYIANRTADRYSASDIDDWKKSLPKKIFKAPRNETFSSYYTNQYFIVVGVNTKTSEVALMPTNNIDLVQWIAISEMKRYNLGLYEPVW